MNFVRFACILFLLVPVCPAQMSIDQKIADFNQLVALYNKNYGPYEWKKTAFDYDLLKTAPWIDRIKTSSDDLQFYQICFKCRRSLVSNRSVDARRTG